MRVVARLSRPAGTAGRHSKDVLQLLIRNRACVRNRLCAGGLIIAPSLDACVAGRRRSENSCEAERRGSGLAGKMRSISPTRNTLAAGNKTKKQGQRW